MRFRLETLLLATLVLATSMATSGVAWGLVLGTCGLGVVAAVYHPALREWILQRAVLIPLMILLVLAALCLLPAIDTPREPSRMGICANNLKQLGLALHNYHDLHGCFPPAHIADPNGKAMQSWRAMILPLLGRNSLYASYRFDEPWDGPNNRALLAPVDEYQCPSNWPQTPATNYVAVVGPGTSWPGDRPLKLHEVRDPPQSTILLVEFADSDIGWMEPRDLTLEEVLKGFSPEGKAKFTPAHTAEDRQGRRWSFFTVLMADGSVRRISRTATPEQLQAMLTIDGGETIDLDGPPFVDLNRPRPYWLAAFLAMLGSYALLIWRLRAGKRKRISPEGPLECGGHAAALE